MDKLVIREVEETDLPALKSLIVEAFGEGWNLKRFAHKEDFFQTLLDVYLSIFLEPSTCGRVAEVDGQVVGVMLASVKGETPAFRRFLKDIAPNTLTLLSATEAERMDIVAHMSVSFQTIGQLLGGRLDTYDGALELLVVSERAQGLGIGKTLWREAVAYFGSKDVTSVYLIADSRCNVGFYEHSGLVQVASEEAIYHYAAGQRRSDIYVYEYLF